MSALEWVQLAVAVWSAGCLVVTVVELRREHRISRDDESTLTADERGAR